MGKTLADASALIPDSNGRNFCGALGLETRGDRNGMGSAFGQSHCRDGILHSFRRLAPFHYCRRVDEAEAEEAAPGCRRQSARSKNGYSA